MRRSSHTLLVPALFALACIAQTGAARASQGIGSPRTVIAWASNAQGEDSLDQLSLETIARSMGLNPERVPAADAARLGPEDCRFLIIPHASSLLLSPAESQAVAAQLERGLTLVADGPGPLAGALGFDTAPPAPVEEVSDLLQPATRIRWPRSLSVSSIAASPPAGVTIVYADTAHGRTLGAIVKRGRGRCLFIAPLVDPLTPDGYDCFPTLPWTITEGLRVTSLLIRSAADAYFDPGFRWSTSPDSLARLWQSWGIRGVHVAAWYNRSTPPYDYAGLIRALHRRGILAYAWLEWPYVGKEFWDNHPLWRQKNALLEDAHLDFLYLMDLQNPECMEAALGDLAELLRADWDGVDVAEFTLTGAIREALEGPAVPRYFTGFTEVGRRGFAGEEGFDPLELCDPGSHHYWKSDTAGLRAFYRYRTRVNISTERQLLAALRKGDRWKDGGGELMLTIIDNSLHPEFDNLLGFSLEETVRIVNEFDLTLVVEDPYSEWSRPPSRYAAMSDAYRRLLGERPFMIDVNVVQMGADRTRWFPTGEATGTEFLQFWTYASMHTDRVCFYCESTVPERDWKLLPGAMAGKGSVVTSRGEVVVDAPYTVTLRGIREIRTGGGDVVVDGKRWPAWNSTGVIVPAGLHRIRAGSAQGTDRWIRLTGISGELLSARREKGSLEIAYASRGRCAISLDRVPGKVTMDGRPLKPDLYRSGKGCVILAPGGRHRCTFAPR